MDVDWHGFQFQTPALCTRKKVPRNTNKLENWAVRMEDEGQLNEIHDQKKEKYNKLDK